MSSSQALLDQFNYDDLMSAVGPNNEIHDSAGNDEESVQLNQSDLEDYLSKQTPNNLTQQGSQLSCNNYDLEELFNLLHSQSRCGD